MKSKLTSRILNLFVAVFLMFGSVSSGYTPVSAMAGQASSPASTTVTVDGTPSSGTAVPTSSSISFSATTGTGTDRLMLVGVSWNCGTTNRTISSATFTPSGESALDLTLVITQQYNYSTTNYRYTAIYRLLAPPSGVTGTIAIGFSGAVSNGIIAGAVNFAGVDQTTPLGTPGGAVGTGTSGNAASNPTVTLTGLTGDELVFDSVFVGASSASQAITADAGQSALWNVLGYSSSSTSFNALGAASYKQATGTSATMSWTSAGYTSANRWAIAAVPIHPATGGTNHTLTVAVSPAGGGTTTPAVGPHIYAEGTVVEVTATPAAGFEFTDWSGDCTGSGACSVTMNADMNVTANFTAIEYTLTITSEHGTVAKNPDQSTYHYGDVVQLTVTPVDPYIFTGWTGDLTGSANPDTITMDGNKSVTANYLDSTGLVIVDGAPSSGTAAPTSSSISFSVTTGTGSNRLMLVGVSWNCGTTDRTITSATFTPDGGLVQDLTLVITEQYTWTTNNYRYTAIYRLLAPPSGVPGTIDIGFSGAVSNGIIAGAANFAGVDQTTPLGTPGGAVGTGTSSSDTPNPSVTLTGLTGNELIFDSVFMGASSTSHTMTEDSGQTALWNILGYSASSTSFNMRGAASTRQATGTSATMSWTTGGYGTTATRWAIAAVPINPVPAVTGHTVTFYANEGSGTMDPQTASSSTALTLNSFTRTGFTFNGWNTQAGGGGTAYTDGEIYDFSTDLDLYAQWTVQPPTCYALTLSHSGEGTDPTAVPTHSTGCDEGKYLVSEVIALTAHPTSGYQVASWANTDDDTSTALTNQVTMPAGIRTITVTYEAIPVITVVSEATPSDAAPEVGDTITVDINIDISGALLGNYTGTLDWDPAILAYQSYAGAPPSGFTGVVNTSDSATGHIIFNGANASGVTGNTIVLTITFDVVAVGTSALNLDYSVMAAASTFVDLLPYLTINDGEVVVPAPPSHTVTFQANGGTGSMAPQTTNVPTALTLNSFTRSGYTFAGWNTVAGGGGTAYADGATYSFSADIPLYAQWSEILAVTSEATPSDATPDVGDTITVSINIDISGASLGSYTGTLDWDPAILAYQSYSGAPPIGFTGAVNTTSTGTGHIVFNGASSSGATGNTVVLTVTFSVVGSGTSPLNLEYSSMAAAVSFTNLKPYLTITDGEVVVPAATTHTVTFNANGGSGTMTPQVASVPTALTANTFTRSGCTFVGWNTQADGSGTAYTDGQVYAFGADITLYAQWTYTVFLPLVLN
jgi:uncharacterized repeat protein (TIGR02543 family)